VSIPAALGFHVVAESCDNLRDIDELLLREIPTMNFIDQLDPELRVVVEKLPTDRPLDLNDIQAARPKMKKMVTALLANLPAVEGVTSQDQFAPGAQGDPAVRVRVYRPNNHPSKVPALYWIHGGGYVMGDIEQDDRLMKQLVKRISCLAVSVDYRLAPEHPFPAPVEDCYAGLKWLFGHAEELGVDRSRIAIGDASGGGGLCAGLALLARDRGEVCPAFQLLIYPMIDDRNVTPASYAITDPRMWNRESNRLGWKAYLGRDGGGADVSPYAAAARATDLTKLPPAYIPVGALDLFVDENIEYAQRLIQAGVPTELHVYPGAFHGFDVFAPSATVSKQFKADRDNALKRALHGAAT
jgi:acetyl esterase/lipase